MKGLSDSSTELYGQVGFYQPSLKLGLKVAQHDVVWVKKGLWTRPRNMTQKV